MGELTVAELAQLAQNATRGISHNGVWLTAAQVIKEAVEAPLREEVERLHKEATSWRLAHDEYYADCKTLKSELASMTERMERAEERYYAKTVK